MNSSLLTLRRARRTLRNAFRSDGYRLFGPPFARDYLRLAWTSARRWGAADAGSLRMLGLRVDYFNRTDAVFLLHEIFVNATYAFAAAAAAPRVIDCGANIGMATLFFKALHPSATIVAIEPHPATFEQLSRNVTQNHLRDVRLINAAVDEREGTTALVSAAPGSIVASTSKAGHGDAIPVRTIRLSSLIDAPVDFLKLDVEGAEYGVLRDLVTSGAIERVRQMVVEYHDVDGEPRAVDGAIDALKAAGMRVEHLGFDAAARSGLFRASASARAEPSPPRIASRG